MAVLRRRRHAPRRSAAVRRRKVSVNRIPPAPQYAARRDRFRSHRLRLPVPRGESAEAAALPRRDVNAQRGVRDLAAACGDEDQPALETALRHAVSPDAWLRTRRTPALRRRARRVRCRPRNVRSHLSRRDWSARARRADRRRHGLLRTVVTFRLAWLEPRREP